MKNSEYTPVIGLEIHVQLATKTKLFERCPADWFGKEPNTVVGPLSLGLPGTLPVPNKKAIQWAILIGKALNCETNKVSKFDRKHYFYPDLPKGYQISQYDQPFSYAGHYEFLSRKFGKKKKVGITRVHLEEDTGKLIHSGDVSLIDYNRSGVPLVEIVTEPDFDNTDDMKQFLEELQTIIRYLGVSDADMEKGTMRLEPNISVKLKDQKGLPVYKVEVKNINSFRFAKQAADFEIARHIKLLQSGKIPDQETRGFDDKKSITFSQRSKEDADDYRYFPEPDIPPFVFSKSFLDDIEKMMVELPHHMLGRFVDEYGVRYDDAYTITRNREKALYFERVIEEIKENEELNISNDEIYRKVASMYVNKKISEHEPVEKAIAIITDTFSKSQTNAEEVVSVVKQAILENDDIVMQYRSGKDTAINALVGCVMKMTKGSMDAAVVKSELEKALTS